MDNVQKHNTCINVPSSQTFRSYRYNDKVKEAGRTDHVTRIGKIRNESQKLFGKYIIKSSLGRPRYIFESNITGNLHV
jgi:hypothetical protein